MTPLRRYTIGQHGSPWTADLARDEAIRILARVHTGENPADKRSDDRKAMTVTSFSRRFLDEYVDVHLKPRTRGEYRRSVELFIVPKFGSWRMADLSRAEVVEFHGSFRHIPYQANRTLGVLSKMFSLADLWGIRQDGVNPCRGVRRYREKRRERFLTRDEYARLGNSLDEAAEDMPEAARAIRLLALTGCRLREIQTLQWAHVWLDDPRHLGARIGITAVLHSWGAALTHHPHVHMIVPGCGLSPDGQRWISSRPAFLLPVRVLGKLFRRLFLTRLLALFDADRLALSWPGRGRIFGTSTTCTGFDGSGWRTA